MAIKRKSKSDREKIYLLEIWSCDLENIEDILKGEIN